MRSAIRGLFHQHLSFEHTYTEQCTSKKEGGATAVGNFATACNDLLQARGLRFNPFKYAANKVKQGRKK